MNVFWWLPAASELYSHQAHLLAAKAELAFSRFGKLSLADRMAAAAEAAATDGDEAAAGAGDETKE